MLSGFRIGASRVKGRRHRIRIVCCWRFDDVLCRRLSDRPTESLVAAALQAGGVGVGRQMIELDDSLDG